MTLKELFVRQVTSGRYYLTIVGGLVFAYSVYAKILDNQATATILTMIFISYFQKNKANEPKGEKQ